MEKKIILKRLLSLVAEGVTLWVKIGDGMLGRLGLWIGSGRPLLRKIMKTAPDLRGANNGGNVSFPSSGEGFVTLPSGSFFFEEIMDIFVGNDIELSILKFKKKVANSSIFKEIKLRDYAKPSERRKAKVLIAIRRRKSHLKKLEKHSTSHY